MTTRPFKHYLRVLLPVLVYSFALFANTAHATTYPWGIHADGTAGTQPSGPAAQYGEIYSYLGGSLPGATAPAALFLTQSNFDSWVSQLPASSYFESWVNPYYSNPSSQWYGYSWKGKYGFLWGNIWSVTPDGHGKFVTCSATGGAGPIGTPGLGMNTFPGNPSASCAYPPPDVAISANPVTIIRGNTSRITWSATGDTSGGCVIGLWQNGVMSSDPNDVWTVSPSGYRDVTPQNDTEYRMNCYSSGGYATASAFVYVQTPALPTASLSASPTSVIGGSSSTLTYSCTNATSASIDTGIGSVSTSGTRAVTPGGSTTYTLTCTGPGGSATASAGVTVLPPNAPSSLTPTCSADGTHVTLSWPASSGATGYYPRIYTDPKMSTSACTGFGWQEYGPDTRLCYPNPDNGWGGSRTVANFPVTPGKAYSAWVHAGGAGGIDWNQAANTSFTCAGSVNLTAGNTSSSAYNAGASQWFMPNTAEPFAGTVSNSGTAPASNFPNMFQYTNDYNTYYTASAGNASLGANASAGVSGTITFPSAGTWHVRTCADYNTSYGTTITETNEGDNCGAWSDYIVTPPTPTNLTASCNANGTLVTLSWTASPGASFYYVRVPASSPGVCPVNWQAAPWDTNTCIPNPDNVNATSVLFGTIPGHTYNPWWVHGAAAGGEWDNPGTGASFTCAGAADLTPVALTPTTVVAGQSSTFTATLANSGNSATPNFSSTIYVCATGDSSCLNNPMAFVPQSTWDKVLAFFKSAVAEAATSIKITLTGSPIPASSNGTQTGSYTFGASGSYQMRLCADLPGNQVAETNEGDNCGNWALLVVCPSGNTVDGSGNCVAPPATPPTCTFSANPAVSIPSTLSWSSTNATSCTGAGGTFNTSGATSGSQSVNAAGTYQLSCTGAGGACSQSVNVASCTNPAVTLAASQTRVTPGSTVQITYSGSGVQGTCTLTGPGAPGTVTPAACALPSAQFTTPALTTQTMYTLTCGSATQSVTINVVPKFGEF